jgi:hypothetical protein
MRMNYFRRFGFCFLIAMALVTFSSSRLNAQTKDEAEGNSSQEIDSYVRYMPARHLDGSSGKIAIIESAAEYSYKFKAFDKLPVKFSMDNNYIGIEKTEDTLELPAHLVRVSFDAETTLPFFNFDKTYLRVGITPSFYGDDWDFDSSDFRITSRYYLIYLPDDKWTFLYGIAYRPDFTYNFLPILGFIYRPNDKITFNIIPKRPNITYSFNDRISLFAEGGTSFDEFTVTRDNLKNISLLYRRTLLGLGMKLKLNKYIRTSLSAGEVFNRYLEYADSQGKVDIKNGMYAEFRVEITP